MMILSIDWAHLTGGGLLHFFTGHEGTDLLDMVLTLPWVLLFPFKFIDARLSSCWSGVPGTIWDGWTDPYASTGSRVDDVDKISGTDVISVNGGLEIILGALSGIVAEPIATWWAGGGDKWTVLLPEATCWRLGTFVPATWVEIEQHTLGVYN